MQGLIFLQLQKFAQQQGEALAWDRLLAEADLPRRSYAPVRDYPDAEVVALVEAAGRLLNRPAGAVLEAFGEYLAPQFLRLYGRLVQPGWKTLDLVENTEAIIHAAVRTGSPGARPAVIDCTRTSEDELHIIYSSDRHLCGLARGMIRGVAGHYGETVVVTDEACVSRGDPFCALHVTRVRGPLASGTVDTRFLEATPFSGGPVPAAPAEGPPFAFLKPPLEGGELGRIDDYRVLRLVGQGSMGVVFLAEDVRLGRAVALKVMQPAHAQNATMRQRFLREARALAAIKSDHVVTVHDVGCVGEVPYLAMEFLEGESLEALCGRTGRLPLHQAVRVGRETALGLAATHACGFIHRDIKPANLWIEAGTGRVKILDFGVARLTTSGVVSLPGLIVGTPAFMAPEQARGEGVDHRADLFSLGCVLYWLCTDELPFNGADVLSTLVALATHDPLPPVSVAAEVPEAFSELILQMLMKDPAQRPSGSQAVANALAAIERALIESPGRPAGVG